MILYNRTLVWFCYWGTKTMRCLLCDFFCKTGSDNKNYQNSTFHCSQTSFWQWEAKKPRKLFYLFLWRLSPGGEGGPQFAVFHQCKMVWRGITSNHQFLGQQKTLKKSCGAVFAAVVAHLVCSRPWGLVTGFPTSPLRWGSLQLFWKGDEDSGRFFCLSRWHNSGESASIDAGSIWLQSTHFNYHACCLPARKNHQVQNLCFFCCQVASTLLLIPSKEIKFQFTPFTTSIGPELTALTSFGRMSWAPLETVP